MKRKYFSIILVLILAMFLVGCAGGVTTPVISEETQIRDLISKLCLAISDKNWSLAKSYCYPDSSIYLEVEQVESMVALYPQISDVIILINPYIYSIDITGNEAKAIVSFNIQIWYQGEYASNDTEKATTILIKSGGKWYFYW